MSNQNDHRQKIQNAIRNQHRFDIVGTCPNCEAPVKAYASRFVCSNTPESCCLALDRGHLKKRGKPVITDEEMIHLLAPKMIMLNGLRDRVGQPFSCYGKIDWSRKHGWRIKFGQNNIRNPKINTPRRARQRRERRRMLREMCR